jgi:hypothetical protein
LTGSRDFSNHYSLKQNMQGDRKLPEKRFFFVLFLIINGLVVLINLIPLESFHGWYGASAELKNVLVLTLGKSPLTTLLQRLAVFSPLGLFTYWIAMRQHWRQPRLLSCTAIVLLALFIELLQALISHRHASLLDFLMTSLLGMGGVWLLPGYGMTRFKRVPTLPSRLLIFANLIVLSLVSIAYYSVKISGWDCSYPLTIANELSRDRPWLGDIRGVIIYSRKLTPDTIQRFATMPMEETFLEPREQQGAVAAWFFANKADNGEIAQSVANGFKAPLIIPLSAKYALMNGYEALQIRQPTVIRTEQDLAGLCHAIMSSQALSIEVEIASADLQQRGPARIVSMSLDPYVRNFTLGQDRKDLVWRVRTPESGPNGTNIQLKSSNQPLTGDWQRIYASYAAGEASLYAGAQPVSSVYYYSDLSYAGLPFVKGTLSLRYLVAILFFANGLAAIGLAASRALLKQRVSVVTLALVMPLMVCLSVTVTAIGAPDITLLAWAFSGAIAGVAMGIVLTIHHRSQ